MHTLIYDFGEKTNDINICSH